MRLLLSALLLTLTLLTGCQRSGVRSFWETHSIDYSDVEAAEDQFARFAELAVASPEEDALAALDQLFDLLKEDEVAYYLYSDWMNGAFYHLLSPCRNAALYGKAVERIVADGVLSSSDCEPFVRCREWFQFNQEGMMASVPGLSDAAGSLILVLDLGCPSCREALEKLAQEPAWSGLRHVAVCCGYGPRPDVPGWEYLFPENPAAVFDPQLTPVFFVVGPDGRVQSSYQLAL